MSNLMPYPSMPPPDSALVPAVSWEPWLKAFSQGCLKRAATESESSPGSNTLVLSGSLCLEE